MVSPNISKVYRTQEEHDPSDIDRARKIASVLDPIPVGILYHDPHVPCYEELRNAGQQRSTRFVKAGFEAELDKFTVWPQGAEARPGA